MALKDILSNPKYGDDIVLSLSDGTSFKLGDVRGYDLEERKELLKRDTDLKNAEAGLHARVTKLRSAGLLDDKLEPVIPDTKVRTAVTQATGLTEDDVLFGPVLAEVKKQISEALTPLTTELNGIKGQVTQLAGVTKNAVKGYMNDFTDRSYASAIAKLPEAVREKVSLKSAMEYAEQHKMFDENGFSDIAGAVDRLSWPFVKEAERATLDKDRNDLKTGREALAAMGRPGASGPKRADTGFSGTDKDGKTLSLDAAMEAAAKDSAIWDSVAQMVQ